MVAVLLADQLADDVEPTIDAHFLRQVWSRSCLRSGRRWLGRHRRRRSIVAYGQVGREEGDGVWSWGVVHPEQRGRGIGSALFDRIEQRASTVLAGVPSPRFRQSMNGADRRRRRDVTAPGLRPIRHFWHMQIDLDGPSRSRASPDGIEIAGIEPRDDLPAIHGILQAAFADDPLDRLEPFDRWAEEHTTGPSYDPTLWLLARDGGMPVGALIANVGEDVGWVDWLAVLGSHRGRGIGRRAPAAVVRHDRRARARAR